MKGPPTMKFKIKDEFIGNLRCGDVLTHVMGFNVCFLKKTVSERGKGKKAKTNTMYKCRYMDKKGILHVHEFYQEELKMDSVLFNKFKLRNE